MAIKTFLTPEEITEMIASADSFRDQFILTFLADVGCRVSELLAITPANIDLERREVLIPHLKRGIKKRCPICNRTAGRNTAFCARCGTDLSEVTPEGIEERSRLVTIGQSTAIIAERLINSLQDREEFAPDKPLVNLTRQMVYLIVRRAAERIGLRGKLFLNPESGKHHYVHPHDFRSSLAVSWLEVAGTDVGRQKALQEHLGHRDFSTTARYNKLSPSLVHKITDEVRERRFGS